MDERGMEEEGKDREGEGWGIKENVVNLKKKRKKNDFGIVSLFRTV
jgi:hypothetical protein